jgi:hypothetical protein
VLRFNVFNDCLCRNAAKSNLAAAMASKNAATMEYLDLQALWVVATEQCDAIQKQYVRCACCAFSWRGHSHAACAGRMMRSDR